MRRSSCETGSRPPRACKRRGSPCRPRSANSRSGGSGSRYRRPCTPGRTSRSPGISPGRSQAGTAHISRGTPTPSPPGRPYCSRSGRCATPARRARRTSQQRSAASAGPPPGPPFHRTHSFPHARRPRPAHCCPRDKPDGRSWRRYVRRRCTAQAGRPANPRRRPAPRRTAPASRSAATAGPESRRNGTSAFSRGRRARRRNPETPRAGRRPSNRPGRKGASAPRAPLRHRHSAPAPPAGTAPGPSIPARHGASP